MRAAIILAFLVAICIFDADAQVLSTIGGSVLIDKAGDELRGSIDHAREAGDELLERANELGRQRLDQIDKILKVTVGDLIGQTEQSSLKILAQAKKDIDAIQESTFVQLNGLIWQSECASKRVVLTDTKEALGKLGTVFGTHQIRLYPPIPVKDNRPWYCTNWWCDDPNIVEIKEPFGETYIEIRDKIEESIASKNITESTPVHSIVGSYEYLSAFALKTSCFYPGSSGIWNKEYVMYKEMAQRWRRVANISIK